MLYIARAYKTTILTKKLELLNNGVVHLYKNNLTLTAANVLSDFTEANFSGYVAVNTSAWTTPVLNSDNRGETAFGPAAFTQTAITVTNNIYGYYVTIGGALAFYEAFDGGPVAMNEVNKQLLVQLQFLEGNFSNGD